MSGIDRVRLGLWRHDRVTRANAFGNLQWPAPFRGEAGETKDSHGGIAGRTDERMQGVELVEQVRPIELKSSRMVSQSTRKPESRTRP